MFWKRDKGKKKERGVMGLGGSAVWYYLRRHYGLNGDEMVLLRRVESDGMIDDKPVTMIRIFNPAAAKEKDAAIEDYHSLDNHPDLILYEGHYCISRGEISDGKIEKR